jgi:hypothetical protein
MGAKSVLELIRAKGEVRHIIDDDQIRNVGVIYDINIDAPAISLSAADIQVPTLPPAPDNSSQNSVGEKIESWQENKKNGASQEKIKHNKSKRSSKSL